jgi:hypothetical protein
MEIGIYMYAISPAALRPVNTKLMFTGAAPERANNGIQEQHCNLRRYRLRQVSQWIKTMVRSLPLIPKLHCKPLNVLGMP